MARWLLAAALLAAVVDLLLRSAGDFDGYLQVGRVALAGGHVYADTTPGLNTWPPFFALLCIPLALLARVEPILARLVWIAVSAGALILALDLVARLIYGRPAGWVGREGVVRVTSVALLVPLLLTIRYVLSNFEHLQVNILIFALALGGLYLQSRGRGVRGGTLVGLAAALKVMPILFVPYLCYRRRWPAAGAALAATAAFTLSPGLVFGPARLVDYLRSWLTVAQRDWGASNMNQSVFAMLDRLIGHGILPFTTTAGSGTRVSAEPMVLVAWAAVAATVALCCWRAFRRPPTPGTVAELLEWSVVFVVCAVFGPVTWKAYLVVLLLPNALLVAIARGSSFDRTARRAAVAVMAAAFTLGGLPSRDLVGTQMARILETSSSVTWAALVMLGGLLWLRARAPWQRRPCDPSEVAAPRSAAAGSSPRTGGSLLRPACAPRSRW